MQTLSQGYKQTVENAFGLSNMLSAAQRAVTRWAIVDDYHALLDLCCPDTNLLRHFAAKYKVRICGLPPRMAEADFYDDQPAAAEVIKGDAADIPWQDGSFHTVFLSAPLETALSEEDVLHEIRRVLRADGSFLASVPFIGHETSLFSFRRRKELLAQLKKTGFTDVSFRISGLGYLTMVARNEGA